MSSKKFRLAAVLLAVLFLIPFFTRVVRTQTQSVWDGESHINIAIDNGDIHVWSIEPEAGRIVNIIVPANGYLSVSSYGHYRAGAIGRLSLLEGKNGSLLVQAMEESLAVPIDAVLIRKEDRKDTFDLTKTFGLSGVKEIAGARQFFAFTNLSVYDVLRLWMLSFQLRKESIETINLAQSEAFSKTTLPDGSEGLTIDTQRFARTAQTYFADQKLKDEHVTIEIINATEKVGQANHLALLLANIGGTVINTQKSDTIEQNSKVITKVKSYTSAKIAKITGGNVLLEQPKEGRADILVVLGGN